VRSVNTVTRWGGEAFVILLPETDATAAAVMAERLCVVIGALRIPLGNSENDDPNSLLRRADVWSNCDVVLLGVGVTVATTCLVL
jgi:PleD family two-component response regulator